MRIAFYAPMKSPFDAVPSGDRAMARSLWRALEQAGHEVALASRFRSWEGAGDAQRQCRLRALGERLAQRLVRRYLSQDRSRRPQIWFTYHLYHKAPDWLGAKVSAALGVPYVVAEASYAPKQARGPWALGHEAVALALTRTDAVLALNSKDIPCVRSLLPDPARLLHLKPFLDAAAYGVNDERASERAALAARYGLDPGVPWLLTVAMMRRGDKLASYRILGQALQALVHERWSLLVAGDGPARTPAEEALRALGAGRVAFIGLQPPETLVRLYATCDLFVWPAVNEAYGMALLEAQACGLPVVAGRAGGVPDVVHHAVTGLLTAPGDAAGFAAAVQALLGDGERRARMGAAASRRVRQEHDIAGARVCLDRLFQALIAEAA